MSILTGTVINYLVLGYRNDFSVSLPPSLTHSFHTLYIYYPIITKSPLDETVSLCGQLGFYAKTGN